MTANGWRTVALGQLAKLEMDRVPVRSDQQYRIAGVLNAGKGLFWRGRIRGQDTTYPVLHRLKTGQLVYRKLTAWEGPIAIVPADYDGAFVSTEFPTFTLDQNVIRPDFMQLVCEHPSLWAEMRRRSTGTALRRNRLRAGELTNIMLTVPDLHEQARIVEVVAVATAATIANRAEQTAASLLLQAASEALLATHDAWDDLPDGWVLRRLEDVADIRSGITLGRRTDKALRAVPFLRAANVQDGYLDLTEIKTVDVTEDEAERFRLELDDVLMIEGGNAEHLGRGWIWEGEIDNCLHQNHVFRVRVDRSRMEPRFLAYAVGASPARAYCLRKAKKTTNLASINKTQISALQIPVPPLDEQQRIVKQLDAIRGVVVAARATNVKSQELRRAIVESFTFGQWRMPARRLRSMEVALP